MSKKIFSFRKIKLVTEAIIQVGPPPFNEQVALLFHCGMEDWLLTVFIPTDFIARH